MKKTKFRVVVEQGSVESFHYVDSLPKAYELVGDFIRHKLALFWCIQYSETKFDGPIRHIAHGRTFLSNELES